MKIIQLHLPDDLADKIQRIKGSAETFIIDLLRTKFSESDKPSSLADQYRLAAKENTVVLKDFSSVDLEGWDDEY